MEVGDVGLGAVDAVLVEQGGVREPLVRAEVLHNHRGLAKEYLGSRDGARDFVGCPALEPLLIPKGSVAVDGVSLTVAALGPGMFEIMLIPHTLAATTELPRSVLTGRALRRFDVDTGAENGTGDTERPGLVADAPTAA